MTDDNRNLEQLIGKAISDPDFRQGLVNDPLGAVDQAGIDLTPEQRNQLANFDRGELERLAEEVDQRISRSLIGNITPDDCSGYATNGSCVSYSTGW